MFGKTSRLVEFESSSPVVRANKEPLAVGLELNGGADITSGNTQPAIENKSHLTQQGTRNRNQVNDPPSKKTSPPRSQNRDSEEEGKTRAGKRLLERVGMLFGLLLPRFQSRAARFKIVFRVQRSQQTETARLNLTQFFAGGVGDHSIQLSLRHIVLSKK